MLTEHIRRKKSVAPVSEDPPEKSISRPIESMGPIKPQERIIEIDVLRGFAILGMVIWDFRSISYGNYASKEGFDYLVCGIIRILDFDNTVYPLFSFLFGWGIAMQMMRSHARDMPFVSMYLRRLLVLCMIGVLNYFLFEKGDILHIYALIGAFLPFFWNRSNRTILVSSALLIATPALVGSLLSIYMSPQLYGTGLGNALTEQLVISTNYMGMVIARMQDFIETHTHPYVYVSNLDILGLFLLGLYVGRRGVFQNIPGNSRFIRRVLWYSLAVGLLWLGWDFAMRQLEIWANGDSGWLMPVYRLLNKWSVQALVKLYSHHALSMFYACVIVLLLQDNRWRRYLRPLAIAGQMALTNYLLKAFIASTIFFGYGLALRGKLGCALGEVLAVVVFGFLIVLGRWWLRRYQFGPVEWLWRSLTYLKFQQMQVRIS